MGTAALVLAACSGAGSGPSAAGGPRSGGSITIGAEAEPACADWIDTCAGSPWGYWMMNPETIPHVFVVDPHNNYRLGAVMAAPPTVSAGPPMTVTYRIDPRAAWSDGQPITSADFHYTWDQIVHGADIISTTGYADITDVRTPSPDVAVAVFAKPYAAWRDLFGADDFGVLPSHILQGHDRDALMRNGYSWSGGPWIVQAWQKGQSITLAPNPAYWGPKPYLDKVTFQIITDTSTETGQLAAGRFDVIYPQPEPGFSASLAHLPHSTFQVSPGLAYEGVFFNVSRAPLDDVHVRQALAYATDRSAIVAQTLGPIQPGAAPLQASIAPATPGYASTPFARYGPDQAMVDQLMTAAGWARGPDGVWARNGQEAVVQLKSSAGAARRSLLEASLQQQWQAAGFGVDVQEEAYGTLFGQDLPAGNFEAAVYAIYPPSPDPGQCSVWCTANVPAQTNRMTGQNWTRITDPGLDAAWSAVDSDLDAAKRARDVRTGEAALASAVPFIPIDALPGVLVWNDDVRGPISDNSATGPFWNIDRWYLAGPPGPG